MVILGMARCDRFLFSFKTISLFLAEFRCAPTSKSFMFQGLWNRPNVVSHAPINSSSTSVWCHFWTGSWRCFIPFWGPLHWCKLVLMVEVGSALHLLATHVRHELLSYNIFAFFPRLTLLSCVFFRRLEQNKITEIPPRAFSVYRRIKRM